MSTKIFKGYRINGVKSLRDLHLRLKKFRQQVEGEAKHQFKVQIARTATISVLEEGDPTGEHP